MCADTTAATTAASKMDQLIQPQVEIRIHAGNGSFEMRSKFSLERKGDKIICGVREKVNSKTFQKLNQKICQASRVWSFESVFDACYWILDSFGKRWMISKVEARVIERDTGNELFFLALRSIEKEGIEDRFAAIAEEALDVANSLDIIDDDDKSVSTESPNGIETDFFRNGGFFKASIKLECFERPVVLRIDREDDGSFLVCKVDDFPQKRVQHRTMRFRDVKKMLNYLTGVRHHYFYNYGTREQHDFCRENNHSLIEFGAFDSDGTQFLNKWWIGSPFFFKGEPVDVSKTFEFICQLAETHFLLFDPNIQENEAIHRQEVMDNIDDFIEQDDDSSKSECPEFEDTTWLS